MKYSDGTFDTKPTHGKRRPNKSKDSIVGCYTFSKDELERMENLFGGKMGKVCFNCPENLREAMKQACKDNGTSTCQEYRKFSVAYVATASMKSIAFGNTMSKVLNSQISIGSINCNQQIQSRLRRSNKNSQKVIDLGRNDNSKLAVDAQSCLFRDCGQPAFAKGTFRKCLGRDRYDYQEFFVCEGHFENHVKANPKDWSNVVMLVSRRHLSEA